MKGKKPKLFVICGPTSSGKTSFAIRLAKRVEGEIVSCDAMQIYRGLPLLTHQPAEKALRGVRHHLVGFLPLHRTFSAAQFSEEARKAIQEILRRKKTPILVGGSGFYLKALLEGVHAPVQADPALRRRYQKSLREKGSVSLYEKLKAIDPERARHIHQRDAYRLIRALEIYETTGEKPSTFGKGGGVQASFRIEKIGLRWERKALYRRINRRVEKMIQEGAILEVKRHLKKRLSPTAKRIIGFKEIASYLKGDYPLEEAVLKIQGATRRYAKRQETWFRKDKEIRWRTIGVPVIGSFRTGQKKGGGDGKREVSLGSSAGSDT